MFGTRGASKIMQRFSVPNNKKILAQASICVNKKGTNPTDEIPSGIAYIFVEYVHFFVPVFYIFNNKIFMKLHN